MYKIYKTKAIVYSRKNFLEKSKNLVLFTHDFGFIYVSAHGISLEKSKNKNIIQVGNLIEVYLIMGKKSWTLTGGNVLDNAYFLYGKSAVEGLLDSMSVLKNNTVFGVSQKRAFYILRERYYDKEYGDEEYALSKKDKAKKDLAYIFSDKKLSFKYNTQSLKNILDYLGYWEEGKDRVSIEGDDDSFKVQEIIEKI